MFSIRIVTTDYYQAVPIPGLDVIYSDFRGAEVKKVPLVRVFGATPGGQKTCMHVHGVFPYLYVPYDGTQPWESYLRQFASSLDKAINVASGHANSVAQHVYKITLVSGIPMYGYHEKEQQFLKIYLYNPSMVRKAADLLLGGAVMNKSFQPHESHIPYTLQFFIDYNLYGMNLLNAGAVKLRRKQSEEGNPPPLSHNDSFKSSQGSDKGLGFNTRTPSILEISGSTTPSRKVWEMESIPRELLLDPDIERHSTCELEVDVVAADILNRLEVNSNLGTNPGLHALWEDERQRHRDKGESSQLTPADSQEREDIESSESEKILQERLRQIILDLQPYIDSQSEAEFEMSQEEEIPSTPASTVDLHLSQVNVGSQDATFMEEEEESEQTKPIVNLESIQRVVSFSQSFVSPKSSQEIVSSQDKINLTQLLAVMAEEGEDSPAASQSAVSIASQISVLEEQDSVLAEILVPQDVALKEDEQDDLEMSQLVEGDEETEVETDSQKDRLQDLAAEYFKIDGLDDTWQDSNLPGKEERSSDEDDIPQFDGAMDEKPEGQKKKSKKRLGIGGPVSFPPVPPQNSRPAGDPGYPHQLHQSYIQGGHSSTQGCPDQMYSGQEYHGYGGFQNFSGQDWTPGMLQQHQQQQHGYSSGVGHQIIGSPPEAGIQSHSIPVCHGQQQHSNTPLQSGKSIQESAVGTSVGQQQIIHSSCRPQQFNESISQAEKQGSSSSRGVMNLKRQAPTSSQRQQQFSNSQHQMGGQATDSTNRGIVHLQQHMGHSVQDYQHQVRRSFSGPASHQDSSIGDHQRNPGVSMQHQSSFQNMGMQHGSVMPFPQKRNSQELTAIGNAVGFPASGNSQPWTGQSQAWGNQIHSPPMQMNLTSTSFQRQYVNQGNSGSQKPNQVYTGNQKSGVAYSKPQQQFAGYSRLNTVSSGYMSHEQMLSPDGNSTNPFYPESPPFSGIQHSYNQGWMHSGQQTLDSGESPGQSYGPTSNDISQHSPLLMHNTQSHGFSSGQSSIHAAQGQGYMHKDSSSHIQQVNSQLGHFSQSSQSPRTLPTISSSGISSSQRNYQSSQGLCSPQHEKPTTALHKLVMDESSQEMSASACSETSQRSLSCSSTHSSASPGLSEKQPVVGPIPNNSCLSKSSSSSLASLLFESTQEDNVSNMSLKTLGKNRSTGLCNLGMNDSQIDLFPDLSPGQQLQYPNNQYEMMMSSTVYETDCGLSNDISIKASMQSTPIAASRDDNCQSSSSVTENSGFSCLTSLQSLVGSVSRDSRYGVNFTSTNIKTSDIEHWDSSYGLESSQQTSSQNWHISDSFNEQPQYMDISNSFKSTSAVTEALSTPSMSQPSLQRSLSLPAEKGKKGRIKKLGLTSRPRSFSILPDFTSPNLSYTFKFHVPAPVIKRLKLQSWKNGDSSSSSESRVVRMHPKDARRYSLLKIGSEIVKVYKLSEAEILKFKNDLKLRTISSCNNRSIPYVEKTGCSLDLNIHHWNFHSSNQTSYRNPPSSSFDSEYLPSYGNMSLPHSDLWLNESLEPQFSTAFKVKNSGYKTKRGSSSNGKPDSNFPKPRRGRPPKQNSEKSKKAELITSKFPFLGKKMAKRMNRQAPVLDPELEEDSNVVIKDVSLTDASDGTLTPLKSRTPLAGRSPAQSAAPLESSSTFVELETTENKEYLETRLKSVDRDEIGLMTNPNKIFCSDLWCEKDQRLVMKAPHTSEKDTSCSDKDQEQVSGIEPAFEEKPPDQAIDTNDYPWHEKNVDPSSNYDLVINEKNSNDKISSEGFIVTGEVCKPIIHMKVDSEKCYNEKSKDLMHEDSSDSRNFKALADNQNSVFENNIFVSYETAHPERDKNTSPHGNRDKEADLIKPVAKMLEPSSDMHIAEDLPKHDDEANVGSVIESHAEIVQDIGKHADAVGLVEKNLDSDHDLHQAVDLDSDVLHSGEIEGPVDTGSEKLDASHCSQQSSKFNDYPCSSEAYISSPEVCEAEIEPVSPFSDSLNKKLCVSHSEDCPYETAPTKETSENTTENVEQTDVNKQGLLSSKIYSESISNQNQSINEVPDQLLEKKVKDSSHVDNSLKKVDYMSSYEQFVNQGIYGLNGSMSPLIEKDTVIHNEEDFNGMKFIQQRTGGSNDEECKMAGKGKNHSGGRSFTGLRDLIYLTQTDGLQSVPDSFAVKTELESQKHNNINFDVCEQKKRGRPRKRSSKSSSLDSVDSVSRTYRSRRKMSAVSYAEPNLSASDEEEMHVGSPKKHRIIKKEEKRREDSPQGIAGIDYIVTGRFKGYKEMRVVLEQINVDEDESVSAKEFLANLEQNSVLVKRKSSPPRQDTINSMIVIGDNSLSPSLKKDLQMSGTGFTSEFQKFLAASLSLGSEFGFSKNSNAERVNKLSLRNSNKDKVKEEKTNSSDIIPDMKPVASYLEEESAPGGNNPLGKNGEFQNSTDVITCINNAIEKISDGKSVAYDSEFGVIDLKCTFPRKFSKQSIQERKKVAAGEQSKDSNKRRKKNSSMHARLSRAFISRRPRRKKNTPPGGGKLMSSLSVLHEATLAKLTTGESYTEVIVDLKSASDRQDVMEKTRQELYSDCIVDDTINYDDAMFKMAYLSPPSSDKESKSPPLPLSPEELIRKAQRKELGKICQFPLGTKTKEKQLLISDKASYISKFSLHFPHGTSDSTNTSGSDSDTIPDLVKTSADAVQQEKRNSNYVSVVGSGVGIRKDEQSKSPSRSPKTAVVKLTSLTLKDIQNYCSEGSEMLQRKVEESVSSPDLGPPNIPRFSPRHIPTVSTKSNTRPRLTQNRSPRVSDLYSCNDTDAHHRKITPILKVPPPSIEEIHDCDNRSGPPNIQPHKSPMSELGRVKEEDVRICSFGPVSDRDRHFSTGCSIANSSASGSINIVHNDEFSDISDAESDVSNSTENLYAPFDLSKKDHPGTCDRSCERSCDSSNPGRTSKTNFRHTERLSVADAIHENNYCKISGQRLYAADVSGRNVHDSFIREPYNYYSKTMESFSTKSVANDAPVAIKRQDQSQLISQEEDKKRLPLDMYNIDLNMETSGVENQSITEREFSCKRINYPDINMELSLNRSPEHSFRKAHMVFNTESRAYMADNRNDVPSMSGHGRRQPGLEDTASGRKSSRDNEVILVQDEALDLSHQSAVRKTIGTGSCKRGNTNNSNRSNDVSKKTDGNSSSNPRKEAVSFSSREGEQRSGEVNKGRQQNDRSILKTKSCDIITPLKPPPGVESVRLSAVSLGLNSAFVQEAFYGRPEDAVERPRELGGRLLRVQSKMVKHLEEFQSLSSRMDGLSTWRKVLSAKDKLFSSQCERENIFEKFQKDLDFRFAITGDIPVIISPCKLPPAKKKVEDWLKGRKLSKYLKNTDMNTLKEEQHNKILDVYVVNQNTKDTEADLVEKKLKPPQNNYGTDANLGLDLGSLGQYSSTKESKDAQSEQSPFDESSPKVNSPEFIIEPLSVQQVLSPGPIKDPPEISLEPSQETHERCLSPAVSKECFEKGLSPTLHGTKLDESSLLHSTPHSRRTSIDLFESVCTPIIEDRKTLQPDQEVATASAVAGFVTPKRIKPFSRRLSSNAEKSLRRAIITNQMTQPFSTPIQRKENTSQIEGPTPKNSFGFKVSQQNLQDSKALHENQYLTVVCLELHIETRGDLRPDPEFDMIQGIFYYIFNDIPTEKGDRYVTGAIILDNNSASPSTGRKSPLPSTSHDQGSNSRNSSSSGISSVKGSELTLLQKSGITDLKVTYVKNEQEIIQTFFQFMKQWDPDILVGYEVQMLSWGYLLQRSAQLSINLCAELSRVPGFKQSSHFSAEKDEWGADHSSEIHIAGRIVLNLWRLLRHEAALNIYTFENVAYHVLHQRIPTYSFRSLTSWFNHRTHLHRWKVIHHYVTRVQGSFKIMDKFDLIGRTSEFARVFGIEFYHVLSRGSQYRVESMMLRIAKPLNFIPVSPSVHQRARMKSPECIALTLEPQSRFYPHPVVVLDFQSLYPSIMIAYNYCFSTCLGRKLKDDVTVSPNGVVFLKHSIRKGILPIMVEEILNTRLMIKNAMKNYKSDKSLHKMLDARQLGLKLIANVTYGYTGANFSGRMPCIEIGDSIVRKARETLERAIKLVEDTSQWGAKVIYGDTDSMFLLMKGRTKEEAFKVGQEIADTVTKMFPKPIKLKFEKVYLPCVLETKKRYVGFSYETPSQKEPIFDAKGIETVRRDNCPAVAKILERSIKILFTTRDVSEVKSYFQRQCQKLMEGTVSVQDFIFAKEFRGMNGYKPGAYVPGLEIAKKLLKSDRRSEPRVGERIPYVIVYGSPGLPLIQLVRQPRELLQDSMLRLNATYYITKQILPPLHRFMSLLGVDVFSWYIEMPKVVRVNPQGISGPENKKGTISQYFAASHCLVCDIQTNQNICNSCLKKPQVVCVTLNDRILQWERTMHHLSQICYTCMGIQDASQPCVSFDCPILYRRIRAKQDVTKGDNLREVLIKVFK
ncbi:hypothetical protein ACJMK2_029895 [Sinanodonta woodiana]|uniref:DNA polymerase zeta catalytic subunit n=1 Tax=Sinanodonta woodiana TaxID=1069815 RepID=A0ABD3XE04_SINWO